MSFSILKSIFYFHYVANTYHRKSMTLYFGNLNPLHQGCFVSSLVETGTNVLENCTIFCYHLPLENCLAPFYKELESAKNVIL